MRNIVFYRAESGASPIEDYLDSLPGKQAQRVAWVLRDRGDRFCSSTVSQEDAGTQDIWEVRVQIGSDIIRLLGFFFGSRSIVLTNGFAKKTRKVPLREIALAEKRKHDYLNRSKTQ